jgi:ADP-ribose pyrophosphatase
MIEFPAGKLDPGEVAAGLCGQRELLEETGYTAREWAFGLRCAAPDVISYSDRVRSTSGSPVAWCPRERQARCQGEFLDVFTATPAEELLEWCARRPGDRCQDA